MKNQVLIAALCAAVSGSVFAQKQNWEWVVDVGSASSQGLRPSETNPTGYEPFGTYSHDNTRWGFIFANGKKTPAIFRADNGEENFFGPYPTIHDGMIRVKEYGSNLYGFMDDQGNLVIPPRFLQVGRFSEGLALAIEKPGDKAGYIDKKGNWAISPRFEYNASNEFSDGLTPQRDAATNKVGFIDKQGNWAIPPQFDGAKPFGHGLAPVSKGNKWGAIDPTGKLVIPYQIYVLERFEQHGWTSISSADGLEGIMDRTGKVLQTPRFRHIRYEPKGWAYIEHKQKYVHISPEGKLLAPVQYSYLSYFSDGAALVQLNENGARLGEPGLFGFIDETGKAITPMKFCPPWVTANTTPTKHFHEGFAAVADPSFPETSRYGYIDKQGNWLVRPQFKNAYDFSEGFAAVTLPDGRWAHVDNTGKIRFLDQFLWIWPFKNGLAPVKDKSNDKYGAIDKTGKLVIAPIFDELEEFAHGVAYAELNGKAGLIRYTGAK